MWKRFEVSNILFAAIFIANPAVWFYVLVQYPLGEWFKTRLWRSCKQPKCRVCSNQSNREWADSRGTTAATNRKSKERTAQGWFFWKCSHLVRLELLLWWRSICSRSCLRIGISRMFMAPTLLPEGGREMGTSRQNNPNLQTVRTENWAKRGRDFAQINWRRQHSHCIELMHVFFLSGLWFLERMEQQLASAAYDYGSGTLYNVEVLFKRIPWLAFKKLSHLYLF